MKRRHTPISAIRGRERHGVAATEFAVCLPLIVVLLVGTLEASTIIFLKQSLSIAAYEGVRTAVTVGATETEIQDAATRILNQRRVADGTVTVSPSPLAAQPVQTWITVDVSAPASSNSVVQGIFMSTYVVRAQATMMKEY